MSEFLDIMAGNEAELTCVNVRDGSDFTVDIPWTASIHKMKKLINAELQLTTLPSDLALYLAKPKESDQWLSPRDPAVRNLRSNVVSDEIQKLLCDELAAGDLVASVVQHAPTSGVIHVLVVPPDASRPSLPPELVEQLQRTFIEGLEKKRKRDEEEAKRAKKVKKDIENIVLIADDEYQLDALAQHQVTSTRIVETPGLHSFWKGYGDFPESYLVRKEEVVFWQVVKSMLTSIDDDNWPRIVFVGSPGVGKSCFLMLVGFYLAGFEKHKVIIVRRLKTAKLVNAVVVLDGTGNEIRAEKYTNLTDEQLAKVVHNRTPGTKVLVDGWTQDEMIDVERRLGGYGILATSCQYDKKSDDRSRLVVLPAWHFDDLLHYARSTNWVVDTGLRRLKNRVATSTWPKLVKSSIITAEAVSVSFVGNALISWLKSKQIAPECVVIKREIWCLRLEVIKVVTRWIDCDAIT